MSPAPTGDLRPCERCEDDTDKAFLVYEYLVDAHDLEKWEQVNRFCPACAQDEADRRAHGLPNDDLLAVIGEGASRLFGEPMSVRWVQGDEHRILVHVRRT